MRFTTQHRIEIDGLRSLAILPVLFFHAGLAPFSGGFVGVDVFFVISGFLISSLLMNELSEGTFSLLTFYERRARRILPALFFVMAITLAASLPWMLPNDLQDLFLSFLGVSTFSSNVLFWLQSGYFDAGVELKPMLHTWSLAVEEQYYLLFPVILMVLWRFGLRLLGCVLAILCIVSFALTFAMQSSDGAANFYLLPTRAWELLLGVFTSLAYAYFQPIHKQSRIFSAIAQPVSAIGVIMILCSCFLFNDTTPFPGTATLLPTMGTCFILFFASEKNHVGRLLSWWPVVGVGLISYSTYLWHQPILALARLNNIHENSLLLAIPLSLILGFLSWRYIEKPFRDRSFLSRNAVLLSAAIVSGVFAITGFIGYNSNGLAFRLSQDEQHIARFTQYPSAQLYRQDTCFLQPDSLHTQFSNECYQFENENNRLLLWGDSHAAALSIGLHAELHSVAQLTSSACPPILAKKSRQSAVCRNTNHHILDFVENAKPHTVWLHANWIDYEAELEYLSDTITTIQNASPTTKIILLGGVPQWKPTLPHVLLKLRAKLASIDEVATPLLTYLRPIDKRIENIAERSSVSFYSLIDIVCNKDNCKATAKKDDNTIEPMAWDAAHLTLAGSTFVVNRLLLQLLSR